MTEPDGASVAQHPISYESVCFEDVRLPLVTVRGAKAGPTLLIAGMQHATEFSGPGAADIILDTIDPARLSGKLAILPIVNPYHAFLTMEEHRVLCKDDETNMNRLWPGDISSANRLARLAGIAWRDFVRHADAVLDMHCCRVIDPRFAACLDGHKPSEHLARSLGLDVVDLQSPESYSGRQLMITAARELDIPAVLVESHPNNMQTREAVAACSAAVLNAMAHLEMIANPAPLPRMPGLAALTRRSDKNHALTCARRGYLGVRRWQGDRIEAGEPAAVVRSTETFDIVERLLSPVDGIVVQAGHPDGGAVVEKGMTAVVIKPETTGA